MTAEEQVDAYRVRFRFRLGPVGCWCHALSKSLSLSECWTFNPDGSGLYQDRDIVGYPRDESEFVWHSVGDWKLSYLVTKTSIKDYGFFYPIEPGGECNQWMEPEPEEPETWHTIDYGFKLVQTKYGDKVAMYSITDGEIDRGFSVEVGNGTWSADQLVALIEP